ncbi:hypothetical protein HQ586_08420 [Candidatus Bathyarchaeota archaeon]|nr:hypothetical protein [Candidatus Bathyarchaeota archaeon]
MSLTSTVGVARTGTMSLRATIPEGIVVFLELEARNKLEWKMEIVDGERVAVVRKQNTDNATKIATKYAKREEE